MSEPVLQTTGLKRTFSQGGADIHVLRGVDLTVGQGEIVAPFRGTDSLYS